MNCTNLNTAAEILEAFRHCKNAGEEIELFDCLAKRPYLDLVERPKPLVTEFVKILQEIKLEPVLALTIQAFGKITDANVKEKLKKSDELLAMLSKQAESGGTHLIRWSAATTIEKLGFDFINVARHLSEEPHNITKRIVESKLKILIEKQKLEERNDDSEFIRFWTYGATFELRVATVGQQNDNSFNLVQKVLENQAVWGIKETNTLLKKVEYNDYPDDSVRSIYENSLFEKLSQSLSSRLLNESIKSDYYNILVENQIHSLQSNDSETRILAALAISKLDRKLLNGFNSRSLLLEAVDLFLPRWETWQKISFNDLTILSKRIENIKLFFKRERVCTEILKWQDDICQEIQQRSKVFEEKQQQYQELNKELNNFINNLRITSNVKINDLSQLPQLTLYNDDSVIRLSKWSEILVDFLNNLNSNLLNEIKNIQSELENLHSIKSHYMNRNKVSPEILWVIFISTHTIGGIMIDSTLEVFYRGFQVSFIIAVIFVVLFIIPSISDKNLASSLEPKIQQIQKYLSSVHQQKLKINELINLAISLKK